LASDIGFGSTAEVTEHLLHDGMTAMTAARKRGDAVNARISICSACAAGKSRRKQKSALSP
jgi:hypothetical protein